MSNTIRHRDTARLSKMNPTQLLEQVERRFNWVLELIAGETIDFEGAALLYVAHEAITDLQAGFVA